MMNDLVFQVQFEEGINPEEVHFSTNTKFLISEMDELPDLCQLSHF